LACKRLVGASSLTAVLSPAVVVTVISPLLHHLPQANTSVRICNVFSPSLRRVVCSKLNRDFDAGLARFPPDPACVAPKQRHAQTRAALAPAKPNWSPGSAISKRAANLDTPHLLTTTTSSSRLATTSTRSRHDLSRTIREPRTTQRSLHAISSSPA